MAENEASPASPNPATYVLAGHDHNGVYDDAIKTYEKAGFIVLRPKEGETFQQTIKAVKPPCHILMACHGGKDGTFTWHEKNGSMSYTRAFIDLQQLPDQGKGGILSMTLQNCYGGTAQNMLGTLSAGAVFQSLSSESIATYGMSIDKFSDEIGAAPTRGKLLLEALDSVDPRTSAELHDAKRFTWPMMFLQNLLPFNTDPFQQPRMWNDPPDPFNRDEQPKEPQLGPPRIQDFWGQQIKADENTYDPKRALPAAIGIGGMPPTLVNLDAEVTKLAASHKANPQAFDAAVTMVRDSFNVLPYAANAKARTDMERDITMPADPTGKKTWVELRVEAVRATSWGKGLKENATQEEFSAFWDKEVARRLEVANAELKAKVDVVADKLKKNEPITIEADGNPDFDELRIRRGIAIANLETTGQLDRLVEEAKTRTARTQETIENTQRFIQHANEALRPHLPSFGLPSMDQLLENYGFKRNNELPVQDPGAAPPRGEPFKLPAPPKVEGKKHVP